MIIQLIFLSILVAGSLIRPTISTGCSLSTAHDFPSKTPILFHHGSNKSDLIYPTNSDKKINFEIDETVRLGCPGSKIKFGRIRRWDTIVISCIGNNKYVIKFVGNKDETVEYSIKFTEYAFENFTCETHIRSVIKDNRERSCLNGTGTLRQMTMDLSNGISHLLMDLCFHEKKYVWAHIKIHPWNTVPPRSRSGTLWRNDKLFHSVSGKEIYRVESQAVSFDCILELPQNPINFQTGMVLSRGHLIPRSYMHYVGLQEAMYDYANVAPQWETINNGNWKQIEIIVRDLSEKLDRELDVWVGNLEVMQMKNKNQRMRNMYLNAVSPSKSIPIPKYFFKTVYDNFTNEGLVFVTINNPFSYDNTIQDSIICRDVCDQIPILQGNNKFSRTNITLGYTFCCEIGDFTMKYPTLFEQNFHGTTLLKF